MYKFYIRCLLFIWKKLSLYRTFFIIQIVFKNTRSFFFAFCFVFFIFIWIIESIENSDLHHDIKRSYKIFESFLSFNDKIPPPSKALSLLIRIIESILLQRDSDIAFFLRCMFSWIKMLYQVLRISSNCNKTYSNNFWIHSFDRMSKYKKILIKVNCIDFKSTQAIFVYRDFCISKTLFL